MRLWFFIFLSSFDFLYCKQKIKNEGNNYATFNGAATDMRYFARISSLGVKFTRNILVWYDK